jgi:hypothetical protein
VGVTGLGIFIFGELKESLNTRRCQMGEGKKKGRDEPKESIKELRSDIKTHQRILELQARLFLMASAFEVQFGSKDVAAIGWLLIRYCEHQDRLLGGRI